MGTAILIVSREGASPGSSWTEKLYLQPGDARRWRLFVGGCAGLAEASEYWNEDTEDYDLPDEIDGVRVVGIEDGVVVGGEPDWFADEDTVEFDSIDEPHVRAWLGEREWNTSAVVAEIAAQLEAPKSPG